MRILIAEDSVDLPREIVARYAGVPVAERFGGRPRRGWPRIDAVVVDCGAGAPAQTAPIDAHLEDDGCEPLEPVPLCPPFDLRDQPECAATVLDALGIALLNRGCLQKGATLIAQALEIRQAHFGEEHPATAASLRSTARVLRMQDDLAQAEATIRTALRIDRRAQSKASPAVVADLVELGVLQLYQGRFAAAQASATEALGILARQRLIANDPDTTRLLDIQGRALHGQGKFTEAHRVLKQALALDAKQVGTDHPKYATHLANFAAVQWAQGDVQRAEKSYGDAIRVYENLQRPGHPNLIDVYANLGSLLAAAGKCEEAQTALCKALALNRQARGATHTLVGHDHANLGRLYYRIDSIGNDSAGSDRAGASLRRAEEQFAKALAIYEKNVSNGSLPNRHPYIAEALTWQGRMLIEDKAPDPAKARRLLERAIRTWGPEYAPNSLERAITGAALGRALFLENRQLARARQLVNRAYPIVVKHRGADSPTARLILAWKHDLAEQPPKRPGRRPRRTK